MNTNIILMGDSYKYSHAFQYPKGTEFVSAYIEPRTNDYEYIVASVGLQALVKKFLLTPITHEDIDEAETIITLHGEPFYKELWEYILEKHEGYLPLRIKSLPEGLVVPTRLPLITVENTDPKCYWLPSFMETVLLKVWYPMTVATISYNIKQVITGYFKETVDDDKMGNINFKLHDFGARGASSAESAAIGGGAHLINFMGTDTIDALVYLRRYYGADMAGYSIPAAEHSTITAWGKENENKAYRNMVELFGGKGKIFACVSDSYDVFNACEHIWGGELRELVINNGGTLVIRPDSGDPVDVTLKVVEILGKKFGYTVNSKGYKVLPDYVRIIQGDGVNPSSIKDILENYKRHGWSADNIAFGMGGALLQKLDRDTFSFAMKTSYAQINGMSVDVYKDPVTDISKRSKKGKVKPLLINNKWSFVTDPGWNDFDSMFEVIYEDGKLMKELSFNEIRANSTQAPFPRM